MCNRVYPGLLEQYRIWPVWAFAQSDLDLHFGKVLTQAFEPSDALWRFWSSWTDTRLIWTWLFTISNLHGQALIIIVVCLTFMSVLTRAVNPGVESSNPSSANILYDVWQKSLWQASFVFHQLPISLCGKAACCLEGMLYEVLVWESQETYE